MPAWFSAAIQCGPPPGVLNAVVMPNDAGAYAVGAVVRYRCSSGYQVEAGDDMGVVVRVMDQGIEEVDSVCTATAQGRWHIVPTCVG